jgi:hypothetical protein
MTQHPSPFGGAYVSGAEQRDERGTFTGWRSSDTVGTYTGVPATGRLGRFVDAQTARPASAANQTVTGSFRTATGSLRTATGSFRTA